MTQPERITGADVLQIIRRRILTLESELAVVLGERDEARARAERWRKRHDVMRRSRDGWKARAVERRARLEYRGRMAA